MTATARPARPSTAGSRSFSTASTNSSTSGTWTWLDHFGNPHSDEMRLEERYRRVNHDTIELVITLTDPKTYTTPWVSGKKTLTRQNLTEFPDELFCVPSEEQEFNRRIRDPAAALSLNNE
jgi:hypothetical protein